MAETIPITRLTIKDAETGTETPVDVKTCARAVVCDENKTVQDHVAALAAHLADKTNPHGVTAAQVGADPSGSAAAVQENLTDHENDKENPHKVTKAQVGLGNVDNTKDLDKPVSTAQQAAIKVVQDALDSHKEDKTNPHGVTAAQVGAATTQGWTSVAVGTNWTADSTNGGHTQTIAVSGILATDNPIFDVVLGADVAANELYLEAYALVTRLTTSAGNITLWANGDAPTTAFTIQLKVVR